MREMSYELGQDEERRRMTPEQAYFVVRGIRDEIADRLHRASQATSGRDRLQLAPGERGHLQNRLTALDTLLVLAYLPPPR